MKNIRHSGIVVGDFKIASKFYGEILHLCLVNYKIEKGEFIKKLLNFDSLTTAKYSTISGDLLELYIIPEYDFSIGAGFNHVAFTVYNLESVRKDMIEAGFNTCSTIEIDDAGKHKVMFVFDPFNNLLELVEEI